VGLNKDQLDKVESGIGFIAVPDQSGSGVVVITGLKDDDVITID